MKKICLVLALLLVLLCACGGKATTATVYDVLEDGEVYTVDREAGTITRGDQVYRYEMEGNTLTITYPNGATYYQMIYSGGYGGGWDLTYENHHDVPGETLAEMVKTEQASQTSSSFNPLGLLLAALGLWTAVAPQSAWYFSYGWRYKNAEPSDAALAVERIIGVLFVVIGVSVLFSG